MSPNRLISQACLRRFPTFWEPGPQGLSRSRFDKGQTRTTSHSLLKDLQLSGLLRRFASPRPPFGLLVKFFVQSFGPNGVADSSKSAQAGLVPALVRQITAVPTSEIFAAWGKVKSSNSPPTVNAVHTQRTDEPIPLAAKIAPCRREGDFVVVVCFLP